MKPDDRVIYSKRHCEWLKVAGRWPSPRLPRRRMVGRVVAVNDNTVTVLWPERPALLMSKYEIPHHLLPTRIHFPDNLERLP